MLHIIMSCGRSLIDIDSILESYVQSLINLCYETNDDNVLRASLPPVPILLQQLKFPILLDMYLTESPHMRSIMLRYLKLIADDVLSRRTQHLRISVTGVTFIDITGSPCAYPNLSALAATLTHPDSEGNTVLFQAVANSDSEVISYLPATENTSAPYLIQ